jgi:hypothetical protein
MRSKNYFLKGKKNLPLSLRKEVVTALHNLVLQMPITNVCKKIGFNHNSSLYRIIDTTRMSQRSAEAILKLHNRVSVFK